MYQRKLSKDIRCSAERSMENGAATWPAFSASGKRVL